MDSGAEIDAFLTRSFLRYFRAGTGAAFDAARLRRDHDLAILRHLWAFSGPLLDLYHYLEENRHEIRAILHRTIGQHDAVVRGPLLSARTLTERLRTGNASVVLFEEPQRSLDHGPNRVLLWVLQEATDLLHRARSLFDPSSTYRERSVEAERMLELAKRNVMLEEAVRALGRLPRPSNQSALLALRSRQGLYRKAERAYRLLSGIESLETASLTTVLHDTLVGPLRRWQRFELLLALSMANALASKLALEVEFLPITAGGSDSPVLRVGPFDIMWQQRTNLYVQPILEPSEAKVRAILDVYGLDWGSDRPDVVVLDRRTLAVVALGEAKLVEGTGDGSDGLRAAIEQLVRYSRGYADTEGVLSRSVAAVSSLGMETTARVQAGVPIARNLTSLIDGTLGDWAARIP